MRSMRRGDREVTDPVKIEQIISNCPCCRLGFCDQGRAYIVPLNFGYEVTDGKYIFYFHGASEGRKIDLIRQTGWASFEMDEGYQLREAEHSYDYTAAFRSIIGGGPVSFVETAEEKRHALSCIMEHLTGRDGWTFPDAPVRGVCIFKLEVEELSCKEHL